MPLINELETDFKKEIRAWNQSEKQDVIREVKSSDKKTKLNMVGNSCSEIDKFI
jgi:soluble P-type ATPase